MSTSARSVAAEWAPGRAARIWRPAGPTLGLVLIAHGRGGLPADPWLDEIAEAHRRRGWAAASGALGGGPFSIAAHVRDFAAFARWALDGPFAPAPPRAALAGHSLGALAAAELAARWARPPCHLIAVAPALSGEALLAARAALGPPAMAALRAEVPDAERDWPRWDARPALARLRAPLGVIVGSEDGLTPPEAARAFFAAGEGRFFAALPGSHHCPEGAAYARALDAALDALGA